MKRYVVLFESFEESFDDFHQKPDTRSDRFYHETAKELIELANQYSSAGIDIDQYSEKYGTATRLADLENDLIVMINDEMGEDIAEEFAAEADILLAHYSEESDLNEKKKGLLDKTSAKKEKKMSDDKMFKKDKDVKDNKIMQANPVKDNFEAPGKRLSMRAKQAGPRQ
jgi:hypothetical protein